MKTSSSLMTVAAAGPLRTCCSADVLSAVILGGLILTFSSAVVPAATIEWTGDNNNAWGNAGNWNPAQIPGAADDVVYYDSPFSGDTTYAGLNNASTGAGQRDANSITFSNSISSAFRINPRGDSGLDNDSPEHHLNIQAGGIDVQTTSPITLNVDVELNAAQTWTVTSGGELIADEEVRGTGTLTKGGDGSLVLSAASSRTSGNTIGTSVDGGTIEVRNNSALGSGGVTFAKGGTLALGADGLSVGNGIGWMNWGGSDPRKILLDLPGSNSGTLSGTITLRNHGVGGNVFEVGTNDTLTLSGKLHNWDDATKSGFTKTGAGTLVLSSPNTATYQSGTVINEGTVQLGDGGANGALATHANSYISVASGATFAINQSDTVTQGTDFDADAITGDGNFVQAGSGTTVLTAANTYTGTTDVDGGTLVFSGSGTISESSAITVNDTATLRFSRNDTWGNAATDTSAPITLNAGSTMESGGYFNTVRDLTLNGGDVDLTGGANATYPALAFKGTVTVGGSQASAVNVISGNYNAISVGDDTLGATVFDVASVVGDVDLTIGAPLQNNVMGSGDITKTGAGILALSGANTYTGNTIIDEGWLELGDGGTSGSLSTSSTITNDGVFAVYRSDTVTQGTDFSGDPITGSGHVMQLGTSGTLVLNAANTHSGGTKIGRQDPAWGGQTVPTQEGGTIEILNSDALGTGELQYQKGGTLELGTGGLSVGNLVSVPNWSGAPKVIRLDEDGSNTGTMSGNVWLQNTSVGSFDVDVGADDTLTMSGAFYDGGAGGVGVDKLGDGTLILTGDSENYSANNTVGNTRIYAGTLQLGDGGTAGTMATAQSISVSAGATFAVNQSDTVTQGTDFSAQALSGDGGFEQMGTGTNVLNAANTYAGNTTISAGTLEIAGSGTLGSGGTYAGGISNSGTFKYNSTADQELSGTISGTGVLDKFNTSTLTLTGVGNSFSELNVARSNLVLSGSSDTTVSGTMRVSWGNEAWGAPAGGGVGSLTVQDSAALTVGGTFTVGQTVGIGGSVTQSGGTVNLNGTATIAVWSNLAGTYTLSGGTLNVTNEVLTAGWDGQGYLNVNGGTANLKGIRYGYGNNGARAGTLTLGGGTLNIGSLGMYKEVGTINLNSGTLGALAGWSSAMNMTLGGSVDIDTSGGDITLGGILSGGGDLTKEGIGTLTFTAANTYSSGTTVNGGTLELNGGFRTIAVGSALTIDSGTVEILGTANNVVQVPVVTIQNGGILTDDTSVETVQSLGAVTFNNGGTLTSTGGGIPSHGNFFLQSASVNVIGNALATISAVEISLNGATTFDVADVTAGTDLLVSSIIQNSSPPDNLIKAGAGTMALSGNSTYSGGTDIDNGTLLVNNTAGTGTGSGAVNVNAGATLGGTGSMDGLVTVAGTGHIAPGSGGIGTLALEGGLTLNNGSILDIEADVGGTCDKIVVSGGDFTGATSADGVTVNVTMSGVMAGPVTYTLMEWSSPDGVELDDFDLVYTGSGGGALSIDGNTLLLTASVRGTLFKFR